MFDRMKDMVDPNQIRDIISEVDFPADKQQIVETAEREGADGTIVSALKNVPDRVYQDPQSLIDEVRNVAGF